MNMHALKPLPQETTCLSQTEQVQKGSDMIAEADYRLSQLLRRAAPAGITMRQMIDTPSPEVRELMAQKQRGSDMIAEAYTSEPLP